MAAIFFAGLAAGYILWHKGDDAPQTKKVLEFRAGGYRFINPLLECDTAEDFISNRKIGSFKEKIEEFIAERIRADGPTRDISVYLRELNDGTWFVIGREDTFIPASLLKVPLMIAVFKDAETDKGLLSKKVVYRRTVDHNAYQGIKPSQVLTPGKEYTIEELVYRMVAFSDNNAYFLLAGQLNPVSQSRIFRDFGMELQFSQGDYMSAISYASFLRVLYNSSYLSRELSEKALMFLADSDFAPGLKAGVPSDIVVSHKFGEGHNVKENLYELHDCGIVYYPSHPYLLCVMTKGTDMSVMAKHIEGISRIAYTEVSKQFGKQD